MEFAANVVVRPDQLLIIGGELHVFVIVGTGEGCGNRIIAAGRRRALWRASGAYASDYPGRKFRCSEQVLGLDVAPVVGEVFSD